MHAPEFSTCEFYWAYADCEDLMDMTEAMLKGEGDYLPSEKTDEMALTLYARTFWLSRL